MRSLVYNTYWWCWLAANADSASIRTTHPPVAIQILSPQLCIMYQVMTNYTSTFSEHVVLYFTFCIKNNNSAQNHVDNQQHTHNVNPVTINSSYSKTHAHQLLCHHQLMDACSLFMKIIILTWTFLSLFTILKLLYTFVALWTCIKHINTVQSLVVCVCVCVCVC